MAYNSDTSSDDSEPEGQQTERKDDSELCDLDNTQRELIGQSISEI